jgi:hypothetical protein
MKRWRLTIGLALTAGSIAWGATAVHALPPGTAPTPGQTMTPASGDASTEITLAVTAPNNVCPGDTATGNYRWNMYVAAAAVDAGTVTWSPGTSGAPTAPGGGFIQVMFSKGAGSAQLSKATAINTGQIVGVQSVDFLTNTIQGNGSYNVGFSCTKPPAPGQQGATERYWQTTITVSDWVSSTNFTWTVTDVPPPPTPDRGTGNTISVTNGNADSMFSLNVLAPSNTCQGDTATGGYRFHQYIAAATVDPGSLSFNAGAFSAPGGEFVQPLYSTTGSPQVNKELVANTGQILGLSSLSFSTNRLPGDGLYNVGFVCTLAGAVTRYWSTPITVVAFNGPTSFNWVVGHPATTQSIFATKFTPGGLIIQQKCGVFGALPAVNDPDLGFLAGLPGAGNLPGPGDPSPSLQCGVDLGTTTLLNTGPRQGQFYGATGRINQIEVIDARPGNQPWTVSALISPFTNGGTTPNDTFSSNLLGWQPRVTAARDVAGFFDRNVLPGPAIEPSADPAPGQSRTLASAPPGKIATFAQLDARLKLLIPATANNGRYSATITFTVI